MKKRNRKRWLAMLCCWVMLLTQVSLSAAAGETGASVCTHESTVTREEAGTAAGCESAGTHTVITVCGDCGEELARETVTDAPLGHEYEETDRKEAECGARGNVTYTCTRCGDRYEEEIPALSHAYQKTETAPTCTEAGVVTYTCSLCGDTYTETGEAAMGHEYEETARTEASVYAEGSVTYTCSRCGDTWSDRIPRLEKSGENAGSTQADSAGDENTVVADLQAEDGETVTTDRQAGDENTVVADRQAGDEETVTADRQAEAETEMTWSDLQAAFTAGGEIVLVNDVTAPDDASALTVPDGMSITLDLNGYTLNRGLTAATAGGNVITNDGFLTIQGTGVITGGSTTGHGGGILNLSGSELVIGDGVTISGNTAAKNGGGVYVSDGAELTMSGSSAVTGNTADSGGSGIYVAGNGSFYMKGGSVTGNTSTYGPGVHPVSGSYFYISGAPVISGNTADRSGAYNLYLRSNTIRVNGALTDGADIHVTTHEVPSDDPVILTQGLSGNGSAAAFTSDKPDYKVCDCDGEAALAPDDGKKDISFSIDDTVSDIWAEVDGSRVTRASEGDTVTIHIDPAGSNNTVNTLTVRDADGTKVTVDENQFTMPGSAVTITANCIEAYDILIVDADGSPYTVNGGTCTKDGFTFTRRGAGSWKAKVGSTVELNWDRDVAQTVKSLSYAEDGVTHSVYNYLDASFVMPAHDVTLTAELETKTEHTITYDSSGFGGQMYDLIANNGDWNLIDDGPMSKKPDDYVYLSEARWYQSGSYALEGIEWLFPDGTVFNYSEASRINGIYYFDDAAIDMPNCDVTLRAKVASAYKVYDLSASASTILKNARVTGDRHNLTEGAAVSFAYPYANQGNMADLEFVFTGIVHFYRDEGMTDEIDANALNYAWNDETQAGSFTMPAYNVYLAGEFLALNTYALATPIEHGTAVLSVDEASGESLQATQDKVITLTVTPDEGYSVKSVDVSGKNAYYVTVTQSETDSNTYTLTPGDSAIGPFTVTVAFGKPHTITCVTYGGVTPDVMIGQESVKGLYAGDTAFLTYANPGEAYVFGVEMRYTDPETNEPVVHIISEPDTFTMPDADITLTPKFGWAWLQAQIDTAEGAAAITLPDGIPERFRTILPEADDSGLIVPGGKTITLDLNGCTLDRNLGEATADGYVLKVAGGASLTVTGGSICGGNNTGDGGGILNEGTLCLEAVEIHDNKAALGGGVYVAENAILQIQDQPIVHDNTNMTGEASNVYLSNPETPISVVGELVAEGDCPAAIGVTVNSTNVSDVITSGLSEYGTLESFFSDDPDKILWLNDDGEALLKAFCTVTFDADGGTGVEAQNIPKGGKATEPAAPTKDGLFFGGWYQVTATSPEETLAETPFDFENAAITADITLKARWMKLAWNFDDEDPLDGWTFVDSDGDGYKWELGYDNIENGVSYTHSSPQALISASFDNKELIRLKPDNWAITPRIRIPEDSELSFWMVAQDPDVLGDIVAVYIGDDLDDLDGWTKIGGDYQAESQYVRKRIDLSDYAGRNCYIAFRHYNCEDCFYVNLDDVSVGAKDTATVTVTFDSDGGSSVDPQTLIYGDEITRPADPTRDGFIFRGWYQVTNADTGDMADTAFVFENSSITEPITLKALWKESSTGLLWDFDYAESYEGWTFIDHDGDGYNWRLGNENSFKIHSSPLALYSESYTQGTSLTPDNWAITPLIRIPEDSELSFWMVAQMNEYPGDNLGVYIGEDLDDLDGWTKIGGDYQAEAEYVQVKIDLSAYAGLERYIAFRHNNCTDFYCVNLDDVSLERKNTPVTVTFDSNGGSEVASQTVIYGEKITPPDDPVRDGFTFLGWQLGGADYDFDAAVTQDIELVAAWEEKPADPVFRSKSLLLSGQIGVNFFMDLSALSDGEKAAGYMEFTVNGKKTSAEFDASFRDKSGKGYYGFTCYVNSVQMADTIAAVYHYGENGSRTVSLDYSVAEYISYFDEHASSYDDKTLALIHSIADYGHHAQPFLAAANKWTIGTDHAEMTKCYTETYDLGTIQNDVQGYTFVKTIEGSGIKKATYRLRLDSETSLDVFLEVEEGTELTASGSFNGNTYDAVKQSDGRYLIHVNGISAHRLGNTITVSGTAGSDFTIKVSALSYVRSVLGSDAFEKDAKNAMAALYQYYDAVIEYRKAGN